ncbi:hypothetical protein SASPL_128608 [Salvia splendens]|uniref:L-dopachrome isomerase n=1 Tax=Salvia splendens TaxID=180675 RepID=A0A8X8ZMN3_SALSN|nr:hypothetical protein SASPL_128608 [Salvia splendens]
MPTLNLFTNVPVDGVVASDILKDATKAVAKIIGKPESYVMVLVNGGVPISFGGTEEPAAYGELISIGGLGPTVNAKLSSTIAEIIQTKLSIDSSRFYVKFYDVQVFNSHPVFRKCLAMDVRVDLSVASTVQPFDPSLTCWRRPMESLNSSSSSHGDLVEAVLSHNHLCFLFLCIM